MHAGGELNHDAAARSGAVAASGTLNPRGTVQRRREVADVSRHKKRDLLAGPGDERAPLAGDWATSPGQLRVRQKGEDLAGEDLGRQAKEQRRGRRDRRVGAAAPRGVAQNGELNEQQEHHEEVDGFECG